MRHQRANKNKNALFGSLSATLRDFRSPSGLLLRVATDLYESLNTPVSLACETLLRYGEYEQLVKKTVDPRDYKSAIEFRDCYQAVSFLKKTPLVIPGIDPEAAAKEKFFASEAQCLATNARFRKLMGSPSGDDPEMKAILLEAVSVIQSVLGSSVNAREWLYACRFGPGAFNHTMAKGLTSLYDKLQVRPSVSHDMKGLGALLVMSQPHWARSVTDSEHDGFWPIIRESDMDLVPGNKIAFVPKTAITHRAIAVEPLVNVYAQLGLGRLMRRKLRARVGLDLDDQSPNQEMARKGSIDGSLATLDLSSASDTVARELVRFLLPHEWFEVLDMTRCKVGYLDGTWLRYEKFSSMGNGFTFELETLIFLSLALACVRRLRLSTDEVRVYGDDIIVPVGAYALLVETLEFCGFSVNYTKSFDSGLFRESCGKDWYDGLDVRPYFNKSTDNEIQHLFRLANGLRMLAHRRNNLIGCDRRLFKPWHTVVRAIPRSVALHLRVPAHAGDSDGIKSNWDESQTSSFLISNFQGWEGVSGIRYQSIPREGLSPSNYLGHLASSLYRLKDDCTPEVIPLNGRDTTKLALLARLNLDRSARPSAVPSSPRLGRDSEYRLTTRAFYGPWTDFGGWVES